MHFRMSPNTFEDLLQKINNTVVANNLNHNSTYPKIPIDKELMITLWYLSNMESFRSVADRFGISKSTCWEVLYRMCNLLLKVNMHYNIISWPNRERQVEISNNFNINNFAGIIGCIDGSHIKIVAPKNNRNSYVNRKNFHSVLLQGVCDHKMLFTDVYTGEVGSLHDYTLYRRSELYLAIQTQQIRFFDGTHLVGDLAYKLHRNLMVGFKDNGHLTLRQKKTLMLF
ncbi:hypothetical protein NQ314_008132 [Rhamnusium bicolor]|uniref:Nuclease HARBI1 n=1 Tax=Rhamnusium bicolor TaxID=1586634 RepID=A0AAV8YGI3_9CUCU|nr:hypothetical protein NQ314_008132 [Rhamnusium bicolor]